MKFNVVDSIMGSGKSQWSFKYMYENKNKKFIYMTPYLDEIDRLLYTKDEEGNILKNDEGYIIGTKWYSERGFREPKQLGEGKLHSLHDLLIREKNIATTHALFKMCTQETLDLIESGGYTLILDEAMDVVELETELPLKDYVMMIKSDNIRVNADKTVTWIDPTYDATFWEFRRKCENGTVVEVKKTNKIHLLIWNFNIKSFNIFKEVFVMTYLFESSLLSKYFKMNNVEYNKFCIEGGKLVDFKHKKPYDKKRLREKIHIYSGNLNKVGDKETALSLNWFKNNTGLRAKLKNNIYNYLRNIVKSPASKTLWTTFLSSKNSLTCRGYQSCFIPCSIKATNEYMDRNVLVYCVNRFMSPDYIHYFENHNIMIDEDMFALSEMIQLIWRTAIRVDKEIWLYIPSSRMRGLLENWLNNENL